uniref:Venom protein family 2 protein 15 n=1 Tax=Lethocerus distinctifemur TaxID=280095 RepID=A0A2K8JVV4_9HEMI|nr:venom protein family 2 protein 15 [Lethocerus distinctifemur]
MNTLVVFGLLLIFAAVGFQEVNSDEFDDWDTDFAIIEDITDPYGDSADSEMARSAKKSILKALKVKRKCDCTVPKVCGCCVLLQFENKFTHKACFNMTEEPGCMRSIQLSMLLDNMKLYSKSIIEKERCAKVPYTAKVAKVCMNVYNITMDENGFHVCAKINLKLLSKEAVNFDFQCLLVANHSIKVEKPSGDPNTALLNFNIGKNITVPHVTIG